MPEHLSDAGPWTIDYDVTLGNDDGDGEAEAEAAEGQGEEEDEEDEDDEARLRWKGRRAFDVRVDAPAGGGLLVRASV